MDMEYEYSENSWTNLWLCAVPTLDEGLSFAKNLIIPNIILRLLIQHISLPHNVRHSLSLVIGTFLLYINFGVLCLYTLALTVLAYVMIIIFFHISQTRRGLMVSISVIAFLLSCELYTVDPKVWQIIRGNQMVAAMKIISVAMDLDRNLFKSMLNPVEFGGYVLCPANCILGPWVSYHIYNQYLNIRFLTSRWIRILLYNLCLSMIYLTMSNCLVPWYIHDDMPAWLIAYRDAQSFRMSQYFVSSMSVVSMISAGFGLTNDCRSEIEVTKPYFIELPRSLVQVVVYWNMPMHQWLKTYVFKTCQSYGRFTAIFVTYAISSLLHGLNFQLSAVLLSIGTFSYVEYNLRFKVAAALEVCCLANPCVRQCDHKHKKYSALAIIINALFSLVAVIHLAYLGVMFEASYTVQETGYSYHHTLEKWSNLNFFSHGFVAFMYVVFLMM